MTTVTNSMPPATTHDPRIVSRVVSFSRSAAVLVLAIGCTALLGWILGIPILRSLRADWMGMKSNAALSIIALAAGLLLARQNGEQGEPRLARSLARGCGGVAALIGTLTLCEYVFRCDLGIDRLLFQEPSGAPFTIYPGRIAPNTALAFLMLGLALVLYTMRSDACQRVGRTLAMAGGSIGLLALLGYAYGISALYIAAKHTAMAFPAAVALTLFSAAYLCARPELGVMSVVSSDSPGGMAIRRLLPLATGVTFASGWVVTCGEGLHWYDTALGVSIFAVIVIIMLAGMIYTTAAWLHRSELERRKGDHAIARLAAVVESSDDAIVAMTLEGIVQAWNRSAERLYGYSASEITGRPISILVPPERPDELAAILGRIAQGESVQHYESERISRNGTRIPVSLAVSPVRDGVGKVIGASTIARDITEQRCAAQELQNRNDELCDANEELQVQSEELQAQSDELQAQGTELSAVNEELRVTVEELRSARELSEARAAELASYISSMVDGVCTVDADRNIVSVNDAGRRIVRTPQHQPYVTWIAGCRKLRLDGARLAPEDEPGYLAVRGESVKDFRYKIVTPYGDEVCLSASAAPVRSRDGGISGATCVFRDIGDQILLERRMDELYRRERHIAEMLQEALIPPASSLRHPRLSIAAKYIPAWKEAEVGGDFYDMFEVSEDKVAIVIGDVAGKGLLAAQRVAGAKHSVRSYAYVDPSPARVVTLANKALSRDGDGNSGMLTLFFAVVDTVSGMMTYANGAHESPVIRRADGRIAETEVTGTVLGVFDDLDYGEENCLLGPGDSIVLFTDGITEARHSGHVLLGKDSVLRFLGESTTLSPDEVATGLLDLARSHAGGSLQDDVAIFVMQRNPERPAGQN